MILRDVAVGGSSTAWLEKEPKEVSSQLKIIYKTPELPSPPLVAHPRVTKRLRQAVIDVVLKLAESNEGRDILKSIRLSKPVKADYKRDYLPLERLELERYVIIGGE